MRRNLFVLLIILSGCANQTAPTGGPKDKTPPELVSSIPASQSTNVKTKKIELEFDEHIKLDKPKDEIIISPYFENPIEFNYRKNKVYIQFENDLPDSTTITINFRDGIKDITEGNSPSDLKLAFSTGSYLDSLFIQGRVIDLLKDKSSNNYTLFLYNVKDTLNIFEDKPLYFTKSNDKGQYKFENIKTGKYIIYALKDSNKDLRLNLSNEPYGFLNDTLTLDNSLDSIRLYTYGLNAEDNKIKSDRQNGTIYEIKFHKPITEYNLLTQTGQKLYSNFTDKNHNAIQVFNYKIDADSIQTIIEYKDSLNTTSQDTTYIKFEETVRKPAPLTMEVKLDKVFPSDGILTGRLLFNKPIVAINFDSTHIYLDSLHIIQLDSSLLIPNPYNDEYYLRYYIDKSLFITESNVENASNNIKQSKTDSAHNAPEVIKPHLYLGVSAFVSVEQDSSSLNKTNLTFTKLDQYGIILFQTDTKYTSYTIQLLDMNYGLIQSITNDAEKSFNKVPPGDYQIRVLIDSNTNGKWEPGNIRKNQMPEPVYFYKNESGKTKITIRANWELGPLQLTF